MTNHNSSPATAEVTEVSTIYSRAFEIYSTAVNSLSEQAKHTLEHGSGFSARGAIEQDNARDVLNRLTHVGTFQPDLKVYATRGIEGRYYNVGVGVNPEAGTLTVALQYPEGDPYSEEPGVFYSLNADGKLTMAINEDMETEREIDPVSEAETYQIAMDRIITAFDVTSDAAQQHQIDPQHFVYTPLIYAPEAV